MATQQRQPASRMSVGGNILSRMLQLEKASKQTRQTIPATNTSEKPLIAAISLVPARQNVHVPASPADVRQSHHPSAMTNSRPPTMPRSQTLPALSLDVESAKPRKDSKTEMADDENSESEICQSPSWSDFGGAKRKKEKKRLEKERKEEEKRLKKEEAKKRAEELKASKRLSKRPPPAAMETQRMPSALRRNSIISFMSSHSSGENSKRNSREEKRLSVSSIDSTKARSHSTPATSTELRPDSLEGYKTVVSPVAPQLPRLPRLGWHSRSGSSGTDKSKSWGSDDVYEKELVKFAYQVQASTPTTDIILGNVKVNQLSVPKRNSGPWPMARSQTDSELARLNGQLRITNPDHRPPQSEDNEHRSSGSDERPTSRESANSDRRGKPYHARHSTSYALASHKDHDGSSYVHKQRMHQQQLSIAGWEAEQAVRIANEMAMKEEPKDESEPDSNQAVPASQQAATSNQSTEQSMTQEKSHVEPVSKSDDRKVEKKEDSQRSVPKGLVLKDARKPTTATSPTSRDSKMNGILGFGRRRKSDQEKTSPPTTSEKKTSRISPPPPPPKDSPPPVPSSTPQEKLNTVKAQKVESKSKALHHRRSETAEIVQPDDVKVQGHSRTRTSSSQLLGEDLQLSRPIHRSTTTPVLTSEMKSGRNKSPSRKSVTFERSVTGENLPKLETALAKAPEIVVETLSPEGIVRKASIKRPRSNPNLQLAAANTQLPSLDFLPQLKHQPLPKRSPNRTSFVPALERPMSQFPVPSSIAFKPTSDASTALPISSSSPNLRSIGGSLRPESYAGASSSSSADVAVRPMSYVTGRRRSMSPSTHTGMTRTSAANTPNVFGRTPTPSESVNAKPVAKLFVICCKCNYWHDLPSHLYEAMCMPKNLTRDAGGNGEGAAEARLETMVKCPWCEHCMATWCCAGWTAILYLQERHH